MKLIKITTGRGDITIPLRSVAEHRADYYACEVDKEEKFSEAWNEEVKWVMEDDFEAIDWIINNSDWVDWKDKTFTNDAKDFDEDVWFDSDNFEIIEIDD